MLIPSAVLKKPGAATPIMPTSVCGDVDVTQSSSYSGSGTTWSNLVAAPADGSTQTNNDFTMINTPTLTGSAGTSAAYWLLNGSNAFKTKNTFSNQLTLYNAHKTTSKWWMALTFNPASVTTTQAPYGDAASSTDHGYEPLLQNNGKFTLFQVNGSSTASNIIIASGAGLLTTSTNYCMIISVDLTTSTNNVRYWLNNRTKTQSSTSWLTETTNANGNYWCLGCGLTPPSTNGLFMANNTRLYGFSYGNDFIDNTDAGKIFDVYNSRQGRTYA